MYVLGIDTSTLTGGVALLRSGQLVGETVLNIRTTHSERLLPALDQLLASSEVALADLAALVVVTGPGSFTGLRIGVATAKGLAFALDLPLLGVTTLAAYGWQFKAFPEIVAALVDARRDFVYSQAFGKGKALTEPAYNSLEEVLAWCSRQDKACLFVGDGAYKYASQIREAVPRAVFSPQALALLRPSAAAGLGYARLQEGETGTAFSINPFYLRKTEAEIKWEKKK